MTHYEKNDAGTLKKRVDNKTEKVLGYQFYCPGCHMLHYFCVDPDATKTWRFDQDEERPTFKPSLLTRFNFGSRDGEKRCHLYVRDGRIEYQDDCSHDLAGETVELPVIQ